MKQTDFALSLSKFLVTYLPNVKGASPRTIDSYRYAFILLLTYFNEEMELTADKIKLSDIKYDNVLGFLEWLQTCRNNSITTRNQRLSALNSFIKFLMYEKPDYMREYQKILSIPIKKGPAIEIQYLKTDGIQLFFDQIPMNTKDGMRDYVMFMLLYTTGIRVSELIAIKVRDLSLQEPFTMVVRGKGGKCHYVPLMRSVIHPLRSYLKDRGLDKVEKLNETLFLNHLKQPFTRQGVNYVIKKYTKLARLIDPINIPENFSPHKMRHTTAMELVDSGVDLIYIRDLLGHVSVKTTEVYAKADASKRRQAIEAASKELVPSEIPLWDNDNNLKDWLKSLNKGL